MDHNPEIRNLYNNYVENKNKNNENPNFEEKENLFFIINHTAEKFTFKNFKSEEGLIDYIGGLNNNDFWEDISISVIYY